MAKNIDNNDNNDNNIDNKQYQKQWQTFMIIINNSTTMAMAMLFNINSIYELQHNHSITFTIELGPNETNGK